MPITLTPGIYADPPPEGSPFERRVDSLTCTSCEGPIGYVLNEDDDTGDAWIEWYFTAVGVTGNYCKRCSEDGGLELVKSSAPAAPEPWFLSIPPGVTVHLTIEGAS